MSLLPKTRYSGFIIIVILFLVLAMGFLLVYTRHQNEQRLINRAFIRLQQNGLSITSKIREYSRLVDNFKPINANPNKWATKGYVLTIGPKESVWIAPNSIEDSCSFTTKRFFSDIIDRSIFDEFCVFNASDLFFKTFPVEARADKDYLSMLKDNLYMPDNYNIFSRKNDSILLRSSLNTGFISKTIINYKKYYQFVYPIIVDNKVWYISGLIYSRNYIAKKQHVETWVLIMIGILLVFTLFSFQFIKLMLITKTERIKTRDTVLICFSFSGLACIVPLLIINLFTVSGIKNNTDEQLVRLNNAIKSDFIEELNLMYNATVGYEKINRDSTPRIHILSTPHFFSGINAINNYPYFKGLFCASIKKGTSDHVISTWEDGSSTSISYRQYVRKNGEWSFPFARGDRRFRLESIYSNTTGDVMAVLSRPSDRSPDSIFCVSSVMYSVINTVLPPGFEFRILGKDGVVWFHSDAKKNNRENFLYECDNNSEIQEAIHNRVSAMIPLQISPKNYKSYISPIGTLPLYLVTLSDTREQNEFLSHVNYIILIFILIGLFCALISSAIFFYEQLGIAFSGRMLNDAEPGLIWLLPDLRKNERYRILFGLNLVLALLILIPVFFMGITVLHYLFILVSLYSMFFMYCYFLLKTFKRKIFKPSIIITFSLILLSCNIIYLIYLPKEPLFFVLEILAGTVIFIVVYRILRHQPYAEEDFQETDFTNLSVKKFGFFGQPHQPYVLFLYSWIMIAAILPTIILFKISEREEVELLTRKNQLDLAKKIERKNYMIDSLYIEHIYPTGKSFNPVSYNNITEHIDRIKDTLKRKGNYFLDQYSQPATGVDIPEKFHGNNPDRNFILLSRKLRQMLGAEDIRSFEMMYGIGLDTTWFWDGGSPNGARPGTLSFYFTATKKSADSRFAAYQINLSSILSNQKTNSRSFDSRLHFLELLVVFMFMVLLFFLIRRVIIKLFILKEPFIPNLMNNDEKLEENGRIFIVNALHQEKIKELVKKPYSVLDSQNCNDWVPSVNNLVIFNTIPENLRSWVQLIKGIGHLLADKKGQIIILSCYSPGQIMEMADDAMLAIADEKTKNSLLRVKQKFTNIFSEFAVYYRPGVTEKDPLPEFLHNCLTPEINSHAKEILTFLKKELDFVSYKGGLDNRLKEIICKENKLHLLRPKLYSLFKLRYQFIWDRFTLNEKFILFDLAMDSVVNTKDNEDIINLFGKGILEVRGRLDFVSRGFKQFVLDLASTEVFQSIQKNVKRTDGWNRIKNPIYIIFGAVVIFFFFTMQDVFTSLFATILSLGGFFTALWRIGLFGKAVKTEK
jgi:hypothetical protein